MKPSTRNYLAPPSEGTAFDALWRVTSFGRDHVPAGSVYWHENADRRPADLVVFQLTVAGELTYRDAEGRHPVPAGSALLFRYGEESGYGLDSAARQDYRSLYICLRGSGLEEHWTAIRRPAGAVLALQENRTIPATLNRLIDMARPHRGGRPSAMASLTHSFVMQLFDHAQALHSLEIGPVDRAVAALRDQPIASGSLKEVAATHGVSREHLSRVFHAQTGQTPAAYMRAACRRHALWLIHNTSLPIGDIARQAGYLSAHTLARQVRHETGHSPQALRSRI